MSKAVKGKVWKEILQTNTTVQSSSKYRFNSQETGQTNNEKKFTNKKLLFGEALKAQIKNNLMNVSTDKRKRTAVHSILGDGTILIKYKITKEVKDWLNFVAILLENGGMKNKHCSKR